jgi:hypothetical protein
MEQLWTVTIYWIARQPEVYPGQTSDQAGAFEKRALNDRNISSVRVVKERF